MAEPTGNALSVTVQFSQAYMFCWMYDAKGLSKINPCKTPLKYGIKLSIKGIGDSSLQTTGNSLAISVQHYFMETDVKLIYVYQV